MLYPRVVSILFASLLAPACSDDPAPDLLLPASYESTFTEVRDCRRNADHELNFVRIVVNDTALPAYSQRNVPFPTGSVIVKEEFDPSDDTCSDSIVGWTVMAGETMGSQPSAGDWEFQRIDEKRQLVDVSTSRCVNCHSNCGEAPDGYLGTCSIP